MPVRPSKPVKKLVILEEGMLTSMANNPAFTKEFPFLKSLQHPQKLVKKGGCGGCGRAGQQKAAVFTTVKQNLASMGDDRRRLLKQMLNATQIRLTYKQGARIIQHTF